MLIFGRFLLPLVLILSTAAQLAAQNQTPTPDTTKLLMQAKNGNVEAQRNLGWAYYRGDGITKDKVEAVRWWRKAAEQGDTQAQSVLGRAYSNGDGVAKDESEGARWFRKAADSGYAKGQNLLGLAYAAGEGVPKDEGEAVRWFRKAAEQGYAEAQFNLAMAQVTGKGVAEDWPEAMSGFRKAAEQGYPYAQKALGIMYDRQGASYDGVESYFWLNLAASTLDSARELRDQVGAGLAPEKRSEIQERCRRWKEAHPQDSQ